MIRDREQKIGVGVEEMTVVGFPVLRFSQEQLEWIKIKRQDALAKNGTQNSEDKLFLNLTNNLGMPVELGKNSFEFVRSNLRQNTLREIGLGLYANQTEYRILPQLVLNKWFLLDEEIPCWVKPELRVGYSRAKAIKLCAPGNIISAVKPQSKSALDKLVAGYSEDKTVRRNDLNGEMAWTNMSRLKSDLRKIDVEIDVETIIKVGYRLQSLRIKNGHNNQDR